MNNKPEFVKKNNIVRRSFSLPNICNIEFRATYPVSSLLVKYSIIYNETLVESIKNTMKEF